MVLNTTWIEYTPNLINKSNFDRCVSFITQEISKMWNKWCWMNTFLTDCTKFGFTYFIWRFKSISRQRRSVVCWFNPFGLKKSLLCRKKGDIIFLVFYSTDLCMTSFWIWHPAFYNFILLKIVSLVLRMRETHRLQNKLRNVWRSILS